MNVNTNKGPFFLGIPMDYFLTELDHQLWELALHSNSLLDRAFAVKVVKLALLAFRKLILRLLHII